MTCEKMVLAKASQSSGTIRPTVDWLARGTSSQTLILSTASLLPRCEPRFSRGQRLVRGAGGERSSQGAQSTSSLSHVQSSRNWFSNSQISPYCRKTVGHSDSGAHQTDATDQEWHMAFLAVIPVASLHLLLDVLLIWHTSQQQQLARCHCRQREFCQWSAKVPNLSGKMQQCPKDRSYQRAAGQQAAWFFCRRQV